VCSAERSATNALITGDATISPIVHTNTIAIRANTVEANVSEAMPTP
jgi:hypothetical protein